MLHWKTILFGLIIFQGFGQYIYTDPKIDKLKSNLQVRGVKFYTNDDLRVKGSPYVFDEFKYGIIHHGDMQIKDLFKLNALTQNIYWGDENKIITPNINLVVELYENMYKYILGRWVTEVAPGLYKYHKGTFKEGYRETNPLKNDQPHKYTVVEKYFILENGKVTSVRKRKALKIINRYK